MNDPIIVTRVRLYHEARSDDWRWTAYAANNRIVAESGEGYRNFEDALRPAASFFPNATMDAADAPVFISGMNANDAWEAWEAQ